MHTVNQLRNLSSLTVTDKDGGIGMADTVNNHPDEIAYLIIYDAQGGNITAGGWLDSAPGALPSRPAIAGKASFAFSVRYTSNASAPTGSIEFQLKNAPLNFKSKSVEWLVVSGARAQFKGTGTINGQGDFGFIATAVDGGKQKPDQLRLQIWTAPDTIVYDNQPDATINSDLDDRTNTSHGSIVIHPKKGPAQF